MSFLNESALWEAGIYQLEITDPVLGGANGVANVQAKQLANRTTFLNEADQVRGYDLTGSAFAGASLDTKLANALATVDHGTRLILPPTEDWWDYEGDHIIDLSTDTGRWLEICGHHSRIKYYGSGTFLTFAADITGIMNPRSTIRGLVIEPDENNHWLGTAIRIQDVGGIMIDRCSIARFGVGLNMRNLAASNYIENTIISNSMIRGCRTQILADVVDGDGSQRATHLINTLLSTTYNPSGYARDDEGDEGEIWHNGLVIDSAWWYHSCIQASLNGKRSRSVMIKLLGGSIQGSWLHFEGEGDAGDEHIVGLWLGEGADGRMASARGSRGLITITGMPDPSGEISEGPNDPVSQLIYDQRTGLGVNQHFGDIQIRGDWNLSPEPPAAMPYLILPQESTIKDDEPTQWPLSGVVTTAGEILKEEYYQHDIGGWNPFWRVDYASPGLALQTTAFASTRPIRLESFPTNERYLTFQDADLETADDIHYIDITDQHTDVIRTFFAGNLDQIRGGILGQVLNVAAMDKALVLKHYTKTNETGITIESSDVEIGDTSVDLKGLTAKIQPGFVFTVANDSTEYTVTTCGAPANTIATVTFSPAAVVAWAHDAVATVRCRSTIKLAGRADWSKPHDFSGVRLVYVEHALHGQFWLQI